MKDRYDWKYMQATVIKKDIQRRKKPLLELFLKMKREMYNEIDKAVVKRLVEGREK